MSQEFALWLQVVGTIFGLAGTVVVIARWLEKKSAGKQQEANERHGQILDAISRQISVGAEQATQIGRLVDVIEKNRVQDTLELKALAQENRENIKLLVEPLIQALKEKK